MKDEHKYIISFCHFILVLRNICLMTTNSEQFMFIGMCTSFRCRYVYFDRKQRTLDYSLISIY